jgi:hypothetical protein
MLKNNMTRITQNDLTGQEQTALINAANFSENIPQRVVEKIEDFVGIPESIDDLDSYKQIPSSKSAGSDYVELDDKYINSLILALDKILHEEIPEYYEEIEAGGGHSGDQKYYYKQKALERSRNLMEKLKSIQS